jgi:hypothetical protein
MDSTALLNEPLRRLTLDRYTTVKAVGIYWDEGGEGFKTECRDFLHFLTDVFHFQQKDEYPIPSTESHLSLGSFISGCVVDINRQAGEDRPALLILHYGGHGAIDASDQNNPRHRAVWTA